MLCPSHLLRAVPAAVPYTVQLFTAESYFTGSNSQGLRVWNVSCNGTSLGPIDVYAMVRPLPSPCEQLLSRFAQP